MNINDYQFKDRLIKGVSENGNFKISVVKTTKVVKAAKEKHNLSLLNTVILGRALTAVMLLASELKGEERIQLRMDGSGPIGFLVAEANQVGEIRGYVKNSKAELNYSDSETHLGQGLGLGILTFSKVLYNEAEPRVSTIELVKGDVTSDVAHFLAQSEQVPSAVLLDVGVDDRGEVNEAGGLLVQRLPGAAEGEIERLQKRLSAFPPISGLLNNGQYIDEIMNTALAPASVKELNRQPVDFFCRCTRKRFLNALSMLSMDDLKDMKGEGQEVVCHYCNKKEFISKEEVAKIITETQAKMN
ncbi:MAG: Hsp33 family molecular chaperone HslO [Balneolaceae bacterium]|nr:Hsp33 family molecular chaperone HslO [Balneolaceae bacterium]